MPAVLHTDYHPVVPRLIRTPSSVESLPSPCNTVPQRALSALHTFDPVHSLSSGLRFDTASGFSLSPVTSKSTTAPSNDLYILAPSMRNVEQQYASSPSPSPSSHGSNDFPFDVTATKRATATTENDVDAGVPDLGTPSTWKVEFRGVVRLVRWVSGRRSGSKKEKARHDDHDAPGHKRHLGRVGSVWNNTRSLKKNTSQAFQDNNADDESPINLISTENGALVHSYRAPSSLPAVDRSRIISEQYLATETTPALPGQLGDPQNVPSSEHNLRLNQPPTRLLSSPASSEYPSTSPLISESQFNMLHLEMDPSRSAPSRNPFGQNISRRPSETSRPRSDIPVLSRLQRTLSLHANFPFSTHDESHASSNPPVYPSARSKSRKLTKPDPSTQTYPPAPLSFDISPSESSASTSSSGSPSVTSRSFRRRLSKRIVPPSAYNAPHTTEGQPPLLASLPEAQLMAASSIHALERAKPKFHFGGEDEEETDDDERHHPWLDTPADGSLSHLEASRAGLPLPRPPLRRSASTTARQRWSSVVTDIPDDEDFLRELNRQLERGGASSIGMHDMDDASSEGGHDSSPSGRWDGTRRTMLCVREIVRTEKSYQHHLTQSIEVLNAAAPVLFLSHFPKLIAASRTLSAAMENDPSASGVSIAFINAAEELEPVLVAWCGVVSSVITSAEVSPTSSTSTSALSRHNSGSLYVFSHMRRSAVSDDGHANYSKKTASGSIWRRGSLPPSTASLSVPGPSTPRPLSLQDVAIMPTQRVARYVMLYRDLLKHTPSTSSSYPLVNGALQLALRIARRCNDAQQSTSLLTRSPNRI